MKRSNTSLAAEAAGPLCGLIGLGPVAKLPEHDGGPGFTRRRLAADKGAGTEIVLELDHPEQVSALHDHCQAHWTVAEALQVRPCGLSDFRVSDPDGYYLRVAHGNAATPEQPPSTRPR